MKSAKSRVPNPTAQATNIVHRNNMRVAPPQGATPSNVAGLTNQTQDTSQNWSGLGATGPAGFFLANGSTVWTAFTTPSIGGENCSYAPYAVALWGGLDGQRSTILPVDRTATDQLSRGLSAGLAPRGASHADRRVSSPVGFRLSLARSSRSF